MPQRAINLFLAIIGVLSLAALILVGVNWRKWADKGSSRRRKIITAGLFVLAWLGIAPAAQAQQPTQEPKAAKAPALTKLPSTRPSDAPSTQSSQPADDLSATPQWQTISDAFKHIGPYTMGPSTTAQREEAKKRIDKAVAAADELAKAGLLVKAEAELLKDESQRLTNAMYKSPPSDSKVMCYSVLLISDARQSYTRLNQRFPLLKEIAKAKTIQPAVMQAVLDSVEKDLDQVRQAEDPQKSIDMKDDDRTKAAALRQAVLGEVKLIKARLATATTQPGAATKPAATEPAPTCYFAGPPAAAAASPQTLKARRDLLGDMQKQDKLAPAVANKAAAVADGAIARAIAAASIALTPATQPAGAATQPAQKTESAVEKTTGWQVITDAWKHIAPLAESGKSTQAQRDESAKRMKAAQKAIGELVATGVLTKEEAGLLDVDAKRLDTMLRANPPVDSKVSCYEMMYISGAKVSYDNLLIRLPLLESLASSGKIDHAVFAAVAAGIKGDLSKLDRKSVDEAQDLDADAKKKALDTAAAATAAMAKLTAAAKAASTQPATAPASQPGGDVPPPMCYGPMPMPLPPERAAVDPAGQERLLQRFTGQGKIAPEVAGMVARAISAASMAAAPATAPATQPVGVTTRSEWQTITDAWKFVAPLAQTRKSTNAQRKDAQNRLDAAAKAIAALIDAGVMSKPEGGLLEVDAKRLRQQMLEEPPIGSLVECYDRMYISPAKKSYDRLALRVPLLEGMAKDSKVDTAVLAVLMQGIQDDLAQLDGEAIKQARDMDDDAKKKAAVAAASVKAAMTKLKAATQPATEQPSTQPAASQPATAPAISYQAASPDVTTTTEWQTITDAWKHVAPLARADKSTTAQRTEGDKRLGNAATAISGLTKNGVLADWEAALLAHDAAQMKAAMHRRPPTDFQGKCYEAMYFHPASASYRSLAARAKLLDQLVKARQVQAPAAELALAGIQEDMTTLTDEGIAKAADLNAEEKAEAAKLRSSVQSQVKLIRAALKDIKPAATQPAKPPEFEILLPPGSLEPTCYKPMMLPDRAAIDPAQQERLLRQFTQEGRIAPDVARLVSRGIAAAVVGATPTTQPATAPAGVAERAEWQTITDAWKYIAPLAQSRRSSQAQRKEAQERMAAAARAIAALVEAGVLSKAEAGLLEVDAARLGQQLVEKPPIDYSGTCYKMAYISPARQSYERIAARLPLVEGLAKDGRVDAPVLAVLMQGIKEDLSQLDEEGIRNARDLNEEAKKQAAAAAASVKAALSKLQAAAGQSATQPATAPASTPATAPALSAHEKDIRKTTQWQVITDAWKYAGELARADKSTSKQREEATARFKKSQAAIDELLKQSLISQTEAELLALDAGRMEKLITRHPPVDAKLMCYDYCPISPAKVGIDDLKARLPLLEKLLAGKQVQPAVIEAAIAAIQEHLKHFDSDAVVHDMDAQKAAIFRKEVQQKLTVLKTAIEKLDPQERDKK